MVRATGRVGALAASALAAVALAVTAPAVSLQLSATGRQAMGGGRPGSYRINCGGPAVREWLPDEAFTNRSASRTFVGKNPGPVTTQSIVSGSVRFDPTPPRVLEFALPVKADAEVSMRLLFSEIFHEAAGERVLMVELAAGGEVLADTRPFDVFGEVGAFAIKSVRMLVRPKAPTLTVRIRATVGNPAIAGIVVESVVFPDRPPLTTAPIVPEITLPVLPAEPVTPPVLPEPPVTPPVDPKPPVKARARGHHWGDGWFTMLNAGVSSPSDVVLESAGRRFPETGPLDLDARTYTEQVAATAMMGVPNESLSYRFMVPLPGDYEVVLGWREPVFMAAGKRVFDVIVSTDEQPARIEIPHLDPWAKTQGAKKVVVAHLPAKGGRLRASEWVRVTLRPLVATPFVNAIIVRQAPVFPVGSKATLSPLDGPPMVGGPEGSPPPRPAPTASTTMTPVPEPTAVETPIVPPTKPSGAPTVDPPVFPSATPSATPSAAPMATASATPSATPTAAPAVPPPAMRRINMGGLGMGGFVADKDVFPPSDALGTSFSARGKDVDAIDNPLDLTIRWGEALAYTLTVQPGMYTLTVSSLELFFSNVGDRLFGITYAVDGGDEQELASDVDLIKDFGKLAPASWTTKPFRVDAVVTVKLLQKKNAACVSSLELVPASVP